jgi:hypothetical protein
MKVDAKLAELAPITHKFAKHSRVGIFRNERTRSTLWDAKLMFWCVSDRFYYCTKVDAKLAELVPLTYKFAKEGSHQNFTQRTHPIHSIGRKTHVLGCFGPFRCCTKVAAKLAELAPLTHKFTKQRHVEMLRNERTRSTLMDTKLMFRGVSDRFVTAQKSMQNRANWYHYRTSSLNNVASEFFATKAPDPLHLSQNSCFRGISDRFVTARKLMQNLPN